MENSNGFRGNNAINSNNIYYSPSIDEPSVVGQGSIVMVEGNPEDRNNEISRGIEKNYYCPVHALQKTIISEPFEMKRDTSVPLVSLPLGQELVQVCSCQLMKKQQNP